MIDYKFREGELLAEVKSYIDSTYGQHYGKDKIQTSEVIVDRGRGMGFFLGNVDKYSNRYGKKGTPDDHRKDLLKVIHYGLLALYEHDRIEGEKVDEGSDSIYMYGDMHNVSIRNDASDYYRSAEEQISKEDVLNFFYGK